MGPHLLLLITACVATTFTLIRSESLPCKPLSFPDGTVCVCTSDYCDTLEPLGAVPANKFYHLVSSALGDRFSVSYGDILDKTHEGEPDVVVKIERTSTFQKIIGFGGAFTDAATINMAKLSSPLQEHIIEAYYGKEGLEYNIGRVNMASCDFSTRRYSYDDVEGDEKLEHFALAEEDVDYKIPFINKAKKLNPNIKFIASPWTSPKWMKTSNEYYGTGQLKKEYYQAWANYFVKFLDEYKKLGVTFWAIAAQNEPLDCLFPVFPINCLAWEPENHRDFIRENLGPTLSRSEHNATKLIILDDIRPWILSYTQVVLDNDENKKFVSGIGVQWYFDFFPPSLLDETHKQFPDHFILGTEACIGTDPLESPVVLGSWARAERYASSIIQDLNHWVTGWTDWNLVLDMSGGPNMINNNADAAIIADMANDRVFKQPMYYALGHFSKFIPENSVRVGATSEDFKRLEVLAALRPDGLVTAVILNRNDEPLTLSLEDGPDRVIRVYVEAHSLNTICF